MPENEDEIEIKLDKTVHFFSFISDLTCLIYLNGDSDGIVVFGNIESPITLKDIPVWKLKVKRDQIGGEMHFNYYGMY